MSTNLFIFLHFNFKIFVYIIFYLDCRGEREREKSRVDLGKVSGTREEERSSVRQMLD